MPRSELLDPSARWAEHDVVYGYEYFRPIVAAEATRANPCFSFPVGDGVHDTRPYVQFQFPIDLDAIAVEFDLDNGMELVTSPRPMVTYSNSVGGPYQFLGGSDREPGPEQVAARSEWWRAWNTAPREKIDLVNPFLNLRREEPVHHRGYGRAKRRER